MLPDLGYTMQQIEDATGIKRRTIYNAIERGELPARNAQPFTGGPKMKAKRGKQAAGTNKVRVQRSTGGSTHEE